MRSTAILAASLLLTGGCYRDISNEERLEREAPPTVERSELDPQALAQISCADTKERIAEVHTTRGGDRERLSGYLELFKSVQTRANTLQEAVTRNPDFIYRDEYRVILDAHEYCKEQAEGVREEFERYTRELIQTPTVQEMKKGKPQTLARVDFVLLREAIGALAPEDQAALLTRVDEAEQRVQASEPESSAKSER